MIHFFFNDPLFSTKPQWFRAAKNRDVSTEPHACSVHSFARTTHSFAYSKLLASLARSSALIHLLARSLTNSRACGKVHDSMSQNDLIMSHSANVRIPHIEALYACRDS